MSENSTSFNFDRYAETLASQLVSKISHNSMTVGIFGEWGSGKTELLKEVERVIKRRKEDEKTKEEYKLVFPIFFNAWRYEKEEHLIIPLLMTAYYELRAKQDKSKDVTWLDSFKQYTTALTKGLHKEYAGVDLDKVTDKDLEYEQLYYDTIKELEFITQQDVKLIFLVDDLDRCLPENAIKILESIKLFLDIKGCGFILAVDEEVVEIGVEHHYQNYKNNDKNIPITGSEYLEKIIQLPFKLPSLDGKKVEEFLLQNFKDTFQNNKEILDLFVASIPFVPRKLIRAVNLFEIKKELAKDLDLDNFMLAKLTLMELFSPELYRHIYKENGVLHRLNRWKNDDENLDSLLNTAYLKEENSKLDDHLDKEFAESIVEKLELLKVQRGKFSIDKIFESKLDLATANLNRYFTFLERPRKEETKEVKQLENRERFISFASGLDREKLQEAIANESLAENILDSKDVDEILKNIKEKTLPFSWLEEIAPIVSKKDYQRLFEESGFLEQLVQEYKREQTYE